MTEPDSPTHHSQRMRTGGDHLPPTPARLGDEPAQLGPAPVPNPAPAAANISTGPSSSSGPVIVLGEGTTMSDVIRSAVTAAERELGHSEGMWERCTVSRALNPNRVDSLHALTSLLTAPLDVYNLGQLAPAVARHAVKKALESATVSTADAILLQSRMSQVESEMTKATARCTELRKMVNLLHDKNRDKKKELDAVQAAYSSQREQVRAQIGAWQAGAAARRRSISLEEMEEAIAGLQGVNLQRMLPSLRTASTLLPRPH